MKVYSVGATGHRCQSIIEKKSNLSYLIEKQNKQKNRYFVVNLKVMHYTLLVT